MSETWNPPRPLARALANAMLGELRSRGAPAGWPGWAEDICVRACTLRAPSLGLRGQVGSLWRAHGSRAMLGRVKVSLRPSAATELAKTG